MRSLQDRLLWGTGGVIAAGMVVAGLAIYSFTRYTHYAEFDDGLRSKLHAFASLTEVDEEGIKLEFTEFDFKEFVRPERPNYFQVWLENGDVLSRSDQLGKAGLRKQSGTLEKPALGFVRLPDGRRGRQIGATFRPKLDPEAIEARLQAKSELDLASHAPVQPETGRPHQFNAAYGVEASDDVSENKLTIVIACDTAVIDGRLAKLSWFLIFVGVAETLFCLSMLVLVVRGGLRPIRTVSDAIMHIDANALHERIDVSPITTEVAPIVDRLNDLLSRLDNAFHRERAFSCNIAHELRTPLSGLRSTIEVHLSRSHENEEYRNALAMCLETCRQLEELVKNLLELSRQESNKPDGRIEVVRLDELVRECWSTIADRARAKRVRADFDVAGGLNVRADREKLRVILHNLIGNAVSHGDVDGYVAVSAKPSDHSVQVEIENSGNRLSPEQANRVFDRLWRGDSGRGNTGEHFGLGLTLARQLSMAIGASITASVAGDIFRVRLVIPSVSRTEAFQ